MALSSCGLFFGRVPAYKLRLDQGFGVEKENRNEKAR